LPDILGLVVAIVRAARNNELLVAQSTQSRSGWLLHGKSQSWGNLMGNFDNMTGEKQLPSNQAFVMSWDQSLS
jgi:hypothetical protein